MIDGAYRAAGERVRIETVYCLGLCSVGPNARISDLVFSRLDEDRLANLIGDV